MKRPENMTQAELEEYSALRELKREEKNLMRFFLNQANAENNLDGLVFKQEDFPSSTLFEIAHTLSDWRTMNNLKAFVVKTEKDKNQVRISKSKAPKDLNEEWTPFKHREPSMYPDIFCRIENGLRDDWVDPDTHQVWCVKRYLSGETPGIEIMNPNKTKVIGSAYPSVEDAYIHEGLRTEKCLPHMEKVKHTKGKNRRYYF